MRRLVAVAAAVGGLAACAGNPSPPDAAGAPAWFADSADEARAAAGEYPDLADVPERPADERSQAEWDAAVADVEARRQQLIAEGALYPPAEE